MVMSFQAKWALSDFLITWHFTGSCSRHFQRLSELLSSIILSCSDWCLIIHSNCFLDYFMVIRERWFLISFSSIFKWYTMDQTFSLGELLMYSRNNVSSILSQPLCCQGHFKKNVRRQNSHSAQQGILQSPKIPKIPLEGLLKLPSTLLVLTLIKVAP